MNTQTRLLNINFDSCIVNASGVKDTTFKELEVLAKSNSGAIVMKTCTINAREDNPEPRCTSTPFGLIQSMGWPNLGYKKYIEFAKKLKEKCNKPIIASVGGFSIEEYKKITKAFQESEVDLIEISLSCPNLEGHPQIGYDFDETEKLLSQLVNLWGKPIGLKLPAYLDSVLQEKMAKIILKYNISFITCINSLGNSLAIDPQSEKPLIKPRSGNGGLSGNYVKPIALGNVRGFYNLLKDKVFIFGVGGINTGTDVFEFLLAGANAIQIGTTFEKEDSLCFQRIEKELKEILKKRGYKNSQEVTGKLKFL